MIVTNFTDGYFPDDLMVDVKHPLFIPDSGDSLEIHAARIVLLLKFAGGRKYQIVGRTRLAKLDFFVRYPEYLYKAIDEPTPKELIQNIESPMIRYKYGPWDEKYYNIFAFLVAIGLVEINNTTKGDEFLLTEKGHVAASELDNPDFEPIIERCKLAYKHFKNKSGNQLKKLIYQKFPKVVNMSLGEEIK